MIVSHQHKLIFLKPRKVAGTSFEIALSKFLDDHDIISPLARKDEALRSRLGFAPPANFNFGLVSLLAGADARAPRLLGLKLPLKYYNHMPAWLVRLYLGTGLFDQYRKLSIVRNPWDRAVSLFFYDKQSGAKLENFTAYFERHSASLTINRRNYFIGGHNVVDNFIRYEHFEADITKLADDVPGLAGLWDIFHAIKAKASPNTRALTTAGIFAAHPKVNAMIETANAWDIQTFGYRLKD